METFILELAFGRDNARRLQVRPAHRTYLKTLLDRGQLVTAGPWADDSGAMIIYRVADEPAARALLAADPYLIEDTVSVVSLRHWTPILPT
jgi:uncharacterized protein YciI